MRAFWYNLVLGTKILQSMEDKCVCGLIIWVLFNHKKKVYKNKRLLKIYAPASRANTAGVCSSYPEPKAFQHKKSSLRFSLVRSGGL